MPQRPALMPDLCSDGCVVPALSHQPANARGPRRQGVCYWRAIDKQPQRVPPDRTGMVVRFEDGPGDGYLAKDDRWHRIPGTASTLEHLIAQAEA
jgi:hypothetical protein